MLPDPSIVDGAPRYTDMTARVNLPRLFIAHRTSVVCRGLAALVGATFVIALLPGTVAAQHAQPSVPAHVPASRCSWRAG